MTFEEMEFYWDDSIEISDKKYTSKITDNERKPFEEMAKELIEKEVYKAINEILIQRKEKDDLLNELQEIEDLGFLFNKHFDSNNPISQILVGYENLSDFIDNGNRYIEFMKNTLLEDVELRKSRIDGRITNIKRICLENVALILETDGNSRPKHNAEIILSHNNLEVDSKRKPEKEQIGSYKLLKKFPYKTTP